ncbi:MAG: peptide-binding protein [Campylobacterota bacterium]|nr:peptide-binding protein [Campylobacterota bacterium]
MRYIFYILLFSTITLWSSTLQLSISSSPARINPLLATDSASSEVVGYIFNGLVKFDKNGTIVGDLAEKFYFENNTTLIFELRKGVKWHDGKLFSADDVVSTYELLHSPKLVTPYKDDFKYVKKVERLDEYRIRVSYKQPYFKALSIWMMGILPKHLWEKVDDPMTTSLNKLPVGTGPYKLTKPFRVNERIVLEANPDYFIHPPHISKINMHYISDPSTQFITLKAEELDVGGLDPLQMERQLNREFKAYYQLIEQPSYAYTYMGFNLRRKLFQDRRVREAIALAIDRIEIIDLLFFSHGTVCQGPFMPGSDAYPKDFIPYRYDPKKAKSILRSLGYNQSNPLRFELVTNTGNDTRVYAAQIIQHQLQKVGIEMTIRTMEWQAFLNTVVMPHQFDAVLLGWSLSLIPDAYSIWHSDGDKKGGFNFIGYHNDDVDRMIIESEKIVDHKRFDAIYQKIFRQIVSDYPYVFLYIPSSITAVSRDIKGIEPSIIGIKHNQIDWIKN